MVLPGLMILVGIAMPWIGVPTVIYPLIVLACTLFVIKLLHKRRRGAIKSSLVNSGRNSESPRLELTHIEELALRSSLALLLGILLGFGTAIIAFLGRPAY